MKWECGCEWAGGQLNTRADHSLGNKSDSGSHVTVSYSSPIIGFLGLKDHATVDNDFSLGNWKEAKVRHSCPFNFLKTFIRFGSFE